MTAPLAALLPPPEAPALAPEEVLSRFVGWASDAGLSLYPAQEEAILELLDGKHVVLTSTDSLRPATVEDGAVRAIREAAPALIWIVRLPTSPAPS